jgi:hypothetical protein
VSIETNVHYKLELCEGSVPRTTWWKNDERMEPANVWWLTGERNGKVFTSRPATDVEIELWQRLQAAVKA